MATTETVSETREETQQERRSRAEAEHAALRSRRPDALRSTIMTLLASGHYADQKEGREMADTQISLIRYAAAVTKAVAVAGAGAENLSCNTGVEVTFTDDDMTTALLGLSALLEAAPELLKAVEFADEANAKRAGGAS